MRCGAVSSLGQFGQGTYGLLGRISGRGGRYVDDRSLPGHLSGRADKDPRRHLAPYRLKPRPRPDSAFSRDRAVALVIWRREDRATIRFQDRFLLQYRTMLWVSSQ